MQRIRWPKTYISWGASSDSDSDISRPTTPHRASQPVAGVYLFCKGDQMSLSSFSSGSPVTVAAATVAPTDTVFATSQLTIPSLLGIPLLMRSLIAKPPTANTALFSNEAAMYLTYDQIPPSDAIGTVLLVRADREPLTKEMVEKIVAFIKAFGTAGSDPSSWATATRFREFCLRSAPAQVPGGGIAQSTRLGESWLDVGKQVIV